MRVGWRGVASRVAAALTLGLVAACGPDGGLSALTRTTPSPAAPPADPTPTSAPTVLGDDEYALPFTHLVLTLPGYRVAQATDPGFGLSNEIAHQPSLAQFRYLTLAQRDRTRLIATRHDEEVYVYGDTEPIGDYPTLSAFGSALAESEAEDAGLPVGAFTVSTTRTPAGEAVLVDYDSFQDGVTEHIRTVAVRDQTGGAELDRLTFYLSPTQSPAAVTEPVLRSLRLTTP